MIITFCANFFHFWKIGNKLVTYMILNFVPSEFYPIQPWIWSLKKIEMCVSRQFILFFQFCDMEKMVNFSKPPPKTKM